MVNCDPLQLVREATRQSVKLEPFNDEVVRNTIGDINMLFAEALTWNSDSLEKENSLFNNTGDQARLVALKHLIERNKRILLCYQNARLDCVSNAASSAYTLPTKFQDSMANCEQEFCHEYRDSLLLFLDQFNGAVNLFSFSQPPKDLFIQIRVNKDCGIVHTEWGQLHLNANSSHFVRRTDVQTLIDQGGFMDDGMGSQNANINSPVKSKAAIQSLRPVTIKQLIEAKTFGDGFMVADALGHDIELGQVALVGCIRSIKETPSGMEYALEDGTGSIQGRTWQDKFDSSLSVGQWCRIYAGLRSLKDNRHLNIGSIKMINDFNEISFHFLQVISINIGPKKFNTPVISGMELLNPIQKAVLNVYSQCTIPQGLHQASVVRSLSDKYVADDIRDTITWLLAEGYIFETHDANHAKILS